jgi:hypothetical protein
MVRALGLSPAAQLPRRDRTGISCFKRAYGAARYTWQARPLQGLHLVAAVAHNLVLLARLKPG